jgi:hypothetical protein
LLDRVLSESVTALIRSGVITLGEIVVDGTKVVANASRGSFKTAAKLARIEAAVERRLAALKAEIENDPRASWQRKLAVRNERRGR